VVREYNSLKTGRFGFDYYSGGIPITVTQANALPAVLTKWSLPDRHRSLGVPAPLAHCSLRAACSRVRCGTPS
jgi:hypothetical protein